MKNRIATILGLLAALFALSGCAYDAYLQASKAQAEAYAVAQTARYNALAKIAEGGDATARVAATFALAMGQAAPMPQVAPPKDGWDYALAIADRLITVGGVIYPAKMSRDVAMAQARYSAEERTALYGAWQGSHATSVNALRDMGLGMAPSVTNNTTTTTTTTYTANGGRDANAGTGTFSSSQPSTTIPACPPGTMPSGAGSCSIIPAGP
jgi:hypothetical protein